MWVFLGLIIFLIGVLIQLPDLTVLGILLVLISLACSYTLRKSKKEMA